MVYLVFSTAPSRAIARKLAQTALKKRLAACVHLAPPGESYYWWQDRVEKAREITVTFKTSKKTLPRLMQTLKQTHPYQTPEILAIQVDRGDASYLKWLSKETAPNNQSA